MPESEAQGQEKIPLPSRVDQYINRINIVGPSFDDPRAGDPDSGKPLTEKERIELRREMVREVARYLVDSGMKDDEVIEEIKEAVDPFVKEEEQDTT